MKLTDLPEPIQVELIKSATEIFKSNKGFTIYESFSFVMDAFMKTEVKRS